MLEVYIRLQRKKDQSKEKSSVPLNKEYSDPKVLNILILTEHQASHFAGFG